MRYATKRLIERCVMVGVTCLAIALFADVPPERQMLFLALAAIPFSLGALTWGLHYWFEEPDNRMIELQAMHDRRAAARQADE